jgi:GNAT superfamily N-acetyltransferase
VLIRPAVIGDVPRLAEVHVRGWQSGYRGLLPQDLLDGLDPVQREPRWRATLQQAQWPASGTLVAEDGGELVGFSYLRPSRDSEQELSAVGEIASFYVAPHVWRLGIGRGLMGESVRALREAGYARATLWVLDTNERAIAFYEAAGWHADGATKGDVVGGVPIRDVRYGRRLT